MKKIKLMALAALSVFALVSCQQTQEVVDALTMASTQISMTQLGGSYNVSFNTNVDWTAEADKDWITLSSNSGKAGNASLTITVAPYEGYSDRSGNVTIKAGKQSSVYKITQTEAKVFKAGTDVVLSAEEQTIVVNYETNCSYSVVIADDCKDWISQAATKSAPVSGGIELTVKANTGVQAREGQVSFQVDGKDLAVVKITQNSAFQTAKLAGAAYLGCAMKVYDANSWSYLDYSEYCLGLENDDYKIVLAVNVESGADKTVFPTGSFTVDPDFTHAPGTFTTKSEDECYYTVILDKDMKEVEIIDGEIEITKDGDNYTVTAVLMDEKENLLSFGYQGPIKDLEDDSLYCTVQDLSYYGQYATYFTEPQAKNTTFTFCMSAPLAAGAPDLSYFTIDLWRAKDADNLAVPVGTYTCAVTPAPIELPYKNGIIPQQPGTFQWSANDRNYVYTEMKEGGKFSISNVDGAYFVTIVGEIRTYENVYDDSYNVIDVKYGDWIAVDKTVPVVVMPEVSDSSAPIALDEDFVANSSMGGQQQNLYFGDYWETGDIFTVALPYVLNSYTINLALQLGEPYEYARTTPYPVGKYVFAATPEKGKNLILPVWSANKTTLKKSARYFSVENSYTGTVSEIRDGSIVWDGTSITLDLTIEGVSGPGTGKIMKVTGKCPAAFMAATNRSNHDNYKLKLDSEE